MDSFLEFTKDVPSPELFRRWSAVAAVAGALERRIWTMPTHAAIYPNMYVLLVAEPGIGKSNAINQVKNLWVQVDGLMVAPTTVTRASLVDVLRRSTKSKLISRTQPYAYTSLLVAASEFGVLVPAYDLAFMNTLNELYDCPSKFEELIRSRSIEEQTPVLNAQLHMLGGTQPSYLASLLPDAAWSQGFPSRCLMVYSGNQPKVSLFSTSKKDPQLEKDLVHDLECMTDLLGEMEWSPDAGTALNEWHMADYPPRPQHLRLQHYSARRLLHVVKLSMIFSMERSADLIIELEDYQRALDLLIETEASMPEIFKAMGSSDDMRVLEDLTFYVMKEQVRLGGGVPSSRVVQFLAGQIPTHRVKQFIEIAIDAGRLTKDPLQNTFKAKPRQEYDS